MEETEQWKDWSYYGNRKDMYRYANGTFEDFLSLHHVTPKWYDMMKNILALKNGKKLFLKYGRSNMVTYYNSTKEERRAILHKVDSHPGKWILPDELNFSQKKVVSFREIKSNIRRKARRLAERKNKLKKNHE